MIFPFEIPIYKAKKISATYVGNSLVDEYPQSLPILEQDNMKQKIKVICRCQKYLLDKLR